MKTPLCFFITLLLIVFIICSCETNDNGTGALSAEVADWTGCKSMLKSTYETDNTPDNLTCASYTFDELTHSLIIKHINAGFNCCPESLYCHVTLHNGKIIIREYETDAGCLCNCLYDLDIVIKGIQARTYRIEFVEPYAGEQEKLTFVINLAKDKEGSFSVTRNQYPWGILGDD